MLMEREDPELTLYPIIASDLEGCISVASLPLMTVISHAIEDTIIQNDLAVDVFVGFQYFSLWLTQRDRYEALARVCRRIIVWGVPDIEPPVAKNTTFIPLKPLLNHKYEWFLVIDSPSFWTALVAQEMLPSEQPPIGKRQFRAVWSYNRHIVRLLSRKLTRLVDPPVKLSSRHYDEAQQRYLRGISQRLSDQEGQQAYEDALRQHRKALLWKYLLNNDQGIVIIDGKKRVLAVSKAAETLLGVEEWQCRGQLLESISDGIFAHVELSPTASSEALIVRSQGDDLHVAAYPVFDWDYLVGWRIVVEWGITSLP